MSLLSTTVHLQNKNNKNYYFPLPYYISFEHLKGTEIFIFKVLLGFHFTRLSRLLEIRKEIQILKTNIL